MRLRPQNGGIGIRPVIQGKYHIQGLIHRLLLGIKQPSLMRNRRRNGRKRARRTQRRTHAQRRNRYPSLQCPQSHRHLLPVAPMTPPCI